MKRYMVRLAGNEMVFNVSAGQRAKKNILTYEHMFIYNTAFQIAFG